MNPWFLKYLTGASDLLCSFCHLQNSQNWKLHESTLPCLTWQYIVFNVLEMKFFSRHFGITTECSKKPYQYDFVNFSVDYYNICQVSSECFEDIYSRCGLNNILAVTFYETTVVYISDTLLRCYEYLIQIIFAECLQSSPMVSNVSDANCFLKL